MLGENTIQILQPLLLLPHLLPLLLWLLLNCYWFYHHIQSYWFMTFSLQHFIKGTAASYRNFQTYKETLIKTKVENLRPERRHTTFIIVSKQLHDVMHIKCIKASGSGKAAETGICVIWGSLPKISALLQHHREQGQSLYWKLALSLLWIEKNSYMLGQKELVGCGVKYVQALLGCLKKWHVSDLLTPYSLNREPSPFVTQGWAFLKPQSNLYQLK